MHKVLLVSNVLAPYRIPLFNELNVLLLKEKKTLKVVFSSSNYAFRKWNIDLKTINFDYVFLQKENNSVKERTRFLYSKIYKVIFKERPQTIIIGGFNTALIAAIILKLFFSYELIVWSGATDTKNRKGNTLRFLFRKFSAFFVNKFIVYGTKAEEYIYTIKKNAIVCKAYNSIDNSFYVNDKLNTDYSILKFLYVGNFTKGKQLFGIIDFAKKLTHLNHPFKITLIGEGEVKRTLIEKVKAEKLQDYFDYFDFKQKEDLLYYYHSSHFFLFPSNYDIWGLVLNEAMAAGLLVIANAESGAAKDLIDDFKTGVLYDFKDDDFTNIYNLLKNKDYINTIRINAQKNVISNITITNTANQFLKAINA